MKDNRQSLKAAALSSGYVILSELGRGSFSTVHLAIKSSTKSKVALKVLSTSTADEPDLHFRLDHDNIISLYEYFEVAGGRLVMVLEFAKQGDLFHFVRFKRRLGDTQAKSFFADIVDGLCYLHSQLIAHGDLKPNNILIDEFHRAKITDFGHARSCASIHREETIARPNQESRLLGLANKNLTCSSNRKIKLEMDLTTSGVNPSEVRDNDTKDETNTASAITSPAYAAPEIIDGLFLINPMVADVWSLGVTLFYMVSGFLPFGSHSVAAIREGMGKPLRWPRPLLCVSKPCRRLVESLLTTEPSQRPTCHDIQRNNIWVRQGEARESDILV